MFGLKWSLLFLVVLLGRDLEAHQLPWGPPYLSGHDLRYLNNELVEKERGFLVDVPLDYKDPERGYTQIYAHFDLPYDPALPTYLEFTSGPGIHSHYQHLLEHSFYQSLGFNSLHFDQRGIVFSKLPTIDQ